MTILNGCRLGGLGVVNPTSSYATQTTDQTLYLGGSARAGAMPTAVQDATVYTPAATLSSTLLAETEVEEAHHTLPDESAHISAMMPVMSEPTAPRLSLFGSLNGAVARLMEWLRPVPVLESAAVLAAVEGMELNLPGVSYMTSLERVANVSRQIARTAGAGTGAPKAPVEKPSAAAPKSLSGVPAWKIRLYLTPGRK